MSFASAGENLVLYPEANLEVPQSDLYRVYLNDDKNNSLTIYKNVCNKYSRGMIGEEKYDDLPLTKFKDRSIHWGRFYFQGEVVVMGEGN